MNSNHMVTSADKSQADNISTQDFSTIRATFMKRVSGREIPALALKLAYLIAFRYMNVKKQSTFVGQDTLAHELGITTRYVQKLTAILRPLGLAIEPGHGPNTANVYRIRLEPEKTNYSSPIKVEKTNTRAPKRRTTEAGKDELQFAPTYTSVTNPSEANASEGVGERGRELTLADTLDAGTPDGGPLEVEAGYRELRAVYEREYPADNGKQYDQASRNAYARMRAAGVPHEQIMAGARDWVQAYVEGQGVGFLPRLPDWLTCRNWEHEPWQKRRKAAQSKPDRRSLRYAKKDLAREALKHGGYREDANGNLYHPDDFAVAGAVQ